MGNKTAKKIIIFVIFAGVVFATPVYALNDYFTTTYENGFLRTIQFTDPAQESNCQSSGEYLFAIFDANGLLSHGASCGDDFEVDPFNWNDNPYTYGKNNGEAWTGENEQQGQYSTSGTIYYIDDPSQNVNTYCWDMDAWDYGEAGFLSCIGGVYGASISNMFVEGYPDAFTSGHTLANFTSFITDVSSSIFWTLISIIGILAALLGLGFAISRVRRWITGRKA